MTHPIRFEKPAILDLIPHDRHTVIEASAGTGKTYTIERVVVDLLLTQGVSIREILVLTFAERAASELRSRIRSMLGRVLIGQGDAEGPGKRYWSIGPVEREILKKALFEFDTASIDTIHAFYRRILLDHAFHGGRLFDLAQEDGERLFKRAFREALRGPLARDAFCWTALEAWASGRQDPLGSLLKLLIECHRVPGEIRPPYRPEVITEFFSKGSFAEVFSEEGLREIAAELKESGIVSRSASSFVQHLRSIGDGLAELPSLLSVPMLVGTARELFTDHFRYFDAFKAKGSLRTRAKEALSLLDEMKRTLIDPDAMVVQVVLPVIRKTLVERKLQEGLIDFQDMIVLVRDALIEGHGRSLALKKALRCRYRFALIDEFQDTDEVQWDILKTVFLESHEAGKPSNVLCTVGDPKQAIYGFRGADVRAYLDAREAIVGSRTDEVVSLVRNFRSTARMIEAINALFVQSTTRPFFDGEIRYDREVECGRPDLSSMEADGTPSVPLHLLVVDTDRIKVVSDVKQALATAIAEEIRILTDPATGPRFGSSSRLDPIEYRHIFILTCSNTEGDLVARHLRDRSIPFAFYKKDGLLKTREALDVLHLLEAIDDPGDRSRRNKAWLTPFFDVPAARLVDCTDLPETNPLMGRLVRWKSLAEARRYDRLFSTIIDESGVVRRDLFCGRSERRLTNYLHLFEILMEEAQSGGADLADLILRLRAYVAGLEAIPGESGNVQRLETDRSAVQIMTMHRSKGLEAPVVFVFGGLHSMGGKVKRCHVDHKRCLLVGSDPEADDVAAREHREEEQRILYVAATRARARLYLPFIPPSSEGSRSLPVSGVYGQMNERLKTVMVQHLAPFVHHVVGPVDSPHAASPKSLTSPWRVSQEEPSLPIHGEPAPTSPTSTHCAWKPDATLLEDTGRVEEYRGYRRAHRDYSVTSYTRLSRKRRLTDESVEPLEFHEDDDDEARLHLLEGDLPGGIDTGIFLHAVLEEVDPRTFSGRLSPDEWSLSEGVKTMITRQMLRHGLAREYLAQVQRIVFNSWTATIPIPEEQPIAGLHTCEPMRRELEFLFPYPEPAHPHLDEPIARKLTCERGFVKGFIDLLFTHGNRVYFADWKGDVLPDFEAARLAAHVRRYYPIQVRLYTIAVTRLLGVRSKTEFDARFGGFLYLFVRGLDPDGKPGVGIHFERPLWSDVMAWDEEMRDGPDPRDLPFARKAGERSW